MSDDELYRIYIVTFARVKSGGIVNMSDYLHQATPEVFHTMKAQVAVAIATDDAASKTGLCGKESVVTRVHEFLGLNA